MSAMSPLDNGSVGEARARLIEAEQREAFESLASLQYGETAVSEIIRPAAILPETASRLVLAELMHQDVRTGGLWLAEPSLWRRYDRPWTGNDEGSAGLIGTLQVAYGTPTRYEITVFRATITLHGSDLGWTVSALCDEAFGYGGFTLASCPRASLIPPPRPFRLR